MAQLKPVQLFANDTTKHTFTPVVKDGLLVTFASDQGSSVATKPKISLSMRQGRLRKRNTERVKRKVTLKVSVPYQPKVVDGVTPPLDNVEVIVSFNVPVDAESSDIRDAVLFTTSSIGNDVISDVIDNGQFPY